MSSAAAVAAGAVLGASARWTIGELVASDGFPWATLLVNLVGCAAMGWIAVRVEPRTVLWFFVVTGCLGGFTTASTFAVETRWLIDDGRPVTALVYVVASVGFGLTAVSASRTLARRRSTR